MSGMPSFFDHWYFRVPDLVLAALVYLLLARLVLSLILDRANVAMRTLAAVTGPVVTAVGAITPRIVPPALVLLFAIVWLLAARIVLFQVAMAIGMRAMWR